MTDSAELLAELDTVTAKLNAIEPEREALRQRAAELVEALLRADVPPGEVTAHAPFSDAHIRTIRKAAGIPPAKPGIKPRRRTGAKPTEGAQS